MVQTNISVHLTLEAARRVVTLGRWTEFERMLEHAAESVPEARAISVWLDKPYLLDDEPVVLIMTEIAPAESGSDEFDESDPREYAMERWARATFPEEVWRRFLIVVIRGEHAMAVE